MCLLAGTGQSPIYNEPLTAWSRAHARWGLDCCSSRQGGPLPSKHCTAQGLTTTTAAGTDTGNTASVITTQTLLNTVSIVRNPSDQPALFVPPFLCVRLRGGGGGAVVLFPRREDISRALTVLRYSGRPVEGAAGGAAAAAASVAAFFFFFCIQKAPSKRPHLLFSARA